MATNLLDISNLGFAYGELWVIKDYSKQILSGDLIHLCGENGSGKSTLLKLLAGILRPAEGKIQGQVKKSYNGHVLGLHPDLSLIDNLCLGFDSVNMNFLHQLLTETQLKHKKDQALRTLSKGQGEKLALISSILQQPKLWLLDEPFANLDENSEAWLWQHLYALQASGSAIIFTAHQRDFANQGVKIWRM